MELHKFIFINLFHILLFFKQNNKKNKIRNIQYMLENILSLRDKKPSFIIFIMSGGEEICAELRAKEVCRNAFSISWNLSVVEPKFINLIPSLDKVLNNMDKMSSSKIICTEYNKELIGI